MVNDSARIMNDLEVIISTISPDIDLSKLKIRLEEVTSNYQIERKTFIDLEKDISEKIELFISSKRLEGLSEKTLEGYRIELNLFDKYFSKPLVQISTPEIRQFLAKDKHLKMSTIDKKLSVLKTFFGWLVKEEILLRDPTGKINSPKKAQRLPKALSVDELELVRESCETLRERAILEMFYSTGCRLSELANMKISDISVQSMCAKVIGKGNKERIVYLSFKAIHHLRKYLDSRNDDCEYIFVTQRKPFRGMGNRAIQREIDRIERRTNLSKKLTCHVLRHTFAQLSMDAGIELADLQQLMGHSSPSTTLIYSQVSEERKQQAYRRYHVL